MSPAVREAGKRNAEGLARRSRDEESGRRALRARYRNLCKVSNLLIYCNKENSFRFIRSYIQRTKLAVELLNFKESDFIIRQLAPLARLQFGVEREAADGHAFEVDDTASPLRRTCA